MICIPTVKCKPCLGKMYYFKCYVMIFLINLPDSKYTHLFSCLGLAKTILLYIRKLAHIAAGVCAVANVKLASWLLSV